jgi:hypothetical protein
MGQVWATVRRRSLVAAAAACAVGQAAAVNLLENGSFEGGSWADTSQGWMYVGHDSTAMAGWTVQGTLDAHVAWATTPTADGVLAQDGQRSLDLTGFGNVDPYATILQSFATMAGTSYRVSFYLGGIAAYGSPVQVRATAGGADHDFTLIPGSSNTWAGYGFDFVAGGATSTLSLSALRNSGTYYVGLDNVSVTAAVPEPQTYTLMLAGLLVVGWAAGRRRMPGQKLN